MPEPIPLSAILSSAPPRADGSAKGAGFLGLRARPDGGVSSELSMGTTDIDGTEREIPLMVPTLTPAEVDYLLAAPPGDWKHPTMKRIVVKAVDFARARRAEGKPYFATAAESPLAVDDTTIPQPKRAVSHGAGADTGADWFDQWQPGGSQFQGPVLPRSQGDALRGMGLRAPVVRPAVGDPRTGPEVPPTILDKGMNFLRGFTGFGDQGPAGQTWTNAGALVGAAMPLAGIFREAKAGEGVAADLTRLAEEHLANAPVERINGRLFLSTRVPGGATPILGHEGALTTGLADAYRDPKLTKKFADRVRTAPMLTRREQAMNDEGVLDAFVDKAAQNTDALIAMQPEDVKERSGHWYRGGHQLSNEFAARVGVTGDQGVGVMATQSPSKEWPQNVSLAERLMRWWKTFGQTDEVFTQAMADQAAKTTLESAREWAKTNHLDAEETAAHLAKAAQKIQTTYQHVGMPWSALPESQQARMVRAVSELREPQTYPIYAPEGTIIHPVALTAKGEPRTLVWQSYYNLENALSILHDGSDANISLRVGEGQKVRSFFNNLSVPEDVRSVTADTHNVGGANLRPMGGKAPEVKFVMAGPGSKPTGISGAHPLYRDATIQAAKGHGLIPNQAQSISWESIKGLFSPAQRRNTTFVEQAYKIWEEYSRGRIRLEEVHARIYDLAGGLAPPDWAATAHQGGTP